MPDGLADATATGVPDGLADATATGVPDGLADVTAAGVPDGLALAAAAAAGVPDVGELATAAVTALAEATGVFEADVPDGLAVVEAGVPPVDAALVVTWVDTAVDWLVELDWVVVEVADEVDPDEEVCVAELLVVTEVADVVPATLATAVVATVLDVTG